MSFLNRGLSCEELARIASDYLDGLLSPRRAGAVERHLAACPNCPNYMAQLRRTKELAGSLRADDVPEDVLDALARAWDEEHRGG